MKFLDKSGLTYFWGKIKAVLATKANTADLSAVATSGSYSDLSNTPVIPSSTSQLTNDSGFLTKQPIFIATFGTTTNSEIETAISAGQSVFVNIENYMYAPMTARESATSHKFAVTQYNGTDNLPTIGQVTCINDEWNVTYVEVPTNTYVDESNKIFLINVTYANSTYTADKTFAEITEAYNAGKYPVVLKSNGQAYGMYYASSSNISFSSSWLDTQYWLQITSSGTITSGSKDLLPLSGGTMTGNLTLDGDPTSDLQAATKQYVDDSNKTFIVNVTNSDSTYTADKTFAEITAAHSAGKYPVVLSSNGQVYALYYITTSNAVFTSCSVGNQYWIQISSADVTTAGVVKLLKSTGGTMTGDLILNADPTENLQAATKQYVDNASQSLIGSDVEVIAADQIQIGNVVYTIENGVIDENNTDIGAEPRLDTFNSTVQTVTFSPDGKLIVLGGGFTGFAKAYSVSGTTLTYISDIYADNNGTPLDSSVCAVVFSPDGKLLVLTGYFTGKAKVYSVSGTTIAYVSQIYMDTVYSSFSGIVNTARFSPSGDILVIGQVFNPCAKVYSVSGTAITYVSDIYADAEGSALEGGCSAAVFSPDGDILVLGGLFTGGAKVYSVNGTALTYISDIYADNNGTSLSSVSNIAFSPNGDLLVLDGDFTGFAKAYSVNGTRITYASDIYKNASEEPYKSSPGPIVFSSDGSTLVMANDSIKIYSVNDTNITYVSDAYSSTGTYFDGAVYDISLSPDGSTLVLGGYFTERVMVYSVIGTIVTYLNNVYASKGTTLLTNRAMTASFSPDGDVLVLGGAFKGYAKVFSVKNTTITYISDIYADAIGTAIDNNVRTSAFSPDGSFLILGGNFSGFGKIYSVIGTSITYMNDIYANSGSTALDNDVYTAKFSPNGEILVLGGRFSGFAKVYSISSGNITYINEVYADAETTALNWTTMTAAFSASGDALVLGGSFTGYCKVYSITGNAITYVSDVYSDIGTTVLSGSVYDVIFSSKDNILVVVGDFSGKAKVYSANGAIITYISDIYANAGTTALNGTAQCVSFSPDGKMLIIGGQFTGSSKAYSVNGETITYISDIGNVGWVYVNKFSNDGKMFVLGCSNIGCAKAYSVSGTTVTYVPQVNYLSYTNEAHLATAGLPASGPYKIGISKNTMEVNGTGTVTVIADVADSGSELTVDSTPTANSTNPVSSGGVKEYVDTAIQTAIQNTWGASY